MDIDVLRVADLGVLDDAIGLEETTLGVPVARLIDRVREHCLDNLGSREVATCRGKKSNSWLKLKTRRQEMGSVTRDEEDKQWKQRYGKKTY